MNVSYQCGPVITIAEGRLLVDDMLVATFEGAEEETAFSDAFDRYGDAMYRDGKAEGGRVTKQDIDGRYEDDLR